MMGKMQPKVSNRVLNLAMTLVLAMGMSPLPALSQAAYADEGTVGTAIAADTNTGSNGATEAGTATTDDSATDGTAGDVSSTGASSGTVSETSSSIAAGEEAAAATDSTDTESASVTTSTLLPASASTLTPQDVTTYDLCVGGVRVTSANKDNVLVGTSNDGLVVFTPADTSTGTPATLTLGDDLDGHTVSISGVQDLYNGAAIASDIDLTVEVLDPTTLTGASYQTNDGSAAALLVNGALTLYGDNNLTATAGNGIQLTAGIAATSVSISDKYEIPEITATGGSATESYGIYCGPGSLALSGITTLRANGGTGTLVSSGVAVTDKVTLTGAASLIAKGANIEGSGGISSGINADSLAASGSASVEACGGVANKSIGINAAAKSSDPYAIELSGSATLNAQGDTATEASYGIQNVSNTATVKGNATLRATGGDAGTTGTTGTSTGITGKLICDETANGASSTASSGEAAASKALGEAPSLIEEYYWKTDRTADWQYGEKTPYSYTGEELTVAFAPATFPLWVGGTQVTMANKDDVLNDGTVTFTPGVGSSQLGLLELNGANISGTPDVRQGAGIYATKSLQISVSGDNTVTGAPVSGNNYGMCVSGLILGGNGNLDITAANAASGSSAFALAVENLDSGYLADLTIQNSINITTTVPSGSGIGVIADDITFNDTIGKSSLTGIGGDSTEGNAASGSIGISCNGKIALVGHNTLTGIGQNASIYSYGVLCAEASVGGADDTTLVATSGAATAPAGVSCGLYCLEPLSLTGGNIRLQSGTARRASAASSEAIDVSGYSAYRWRASSTDAWSYSANTPYAFDKSQTYMQITAPLGNLWVGGTQVTTENMGDILGNGTASYTPAGSSAATASASEGSASFGTQAEGSATLTPQKTTNYGTLTLTNAEIAGIEGEHNGAAIYSEEPLIVKVEGDNYAQGMPMATDSAYGMFVPGALFVEGTGSLEVAAGSAGDGNSVGVWSEKYSSELLGNVSVSGSVTLIGNSGTVAQSSTSDPWSCLGIATPHGTLTVSGGATVNGTGSPLGGGVTPLSTTGISADTIAVSDNATVNGIGEVGASSFGILTMNGLSLDDNATLSAMSTGGIKAGCGILAESGTTTISGGQLTAKATSDTAGAVLQALSNAPVNNLAIYHWRTNENDAYTLYPTTPYVFSATQTYVQIGTTYDLKVGGMSVTDANKDNVLAGTANDGKVVFVPGGQDGTLGTLHLTDVDVSGLDGIDYGAGIWSAIPITVQLSGSNTVTGAKGGPLGSDTPNDEGTVDETTTDDALVTQSSDDGLSATAPDESGKTEACGVYSRANLYFTGDGSLTTTAQTGTISAALMCLENVTVAENALLTCYAADATFNSLGAAVLKKVDVRDSTTFLASGGTGGEESDGIICTTLNLSDDAIVEGDGGQATDATGNTSAGIDAAKVMVENGILVGTAKSAKTSYGIDINVPDETTATASGNALIVTGGTVIGATDATSSTTVRAFSQAADVSGYDGYMWRASTASGYTYGNYAYSASDTYEEITPAVAPAPEPEPSPEPGSSPSSGSSSATPATGDASGLLPYALAALALCAGGAAITAYRRRRAQR